MAARGEGRGGGLVWEGDGPRQGSLGSQNCPVLTVMVDSQSHTCNRITQTHVHEGIQVRTGKSE